MSQHDFNVANQGFPAFRSDLNNALAALASTSSGASAPTTTYANQFWYDETNNILKMRDEDNANWINLGTLDQVAKTYLPYVNGTAITGMSSQVVAETGTDNATLMTPLRVAQAIAAQAAGLTANVQEFTSSGTWTKPANAKLVVVEIWGGGGGGGSGERVASGQSASGGGGGGGAAGAFKQFRASEVASTVSVTIGAGGAGGASKTVDGYGNSGTNGGHSLFGTYLKGTGGIAGNNTTGGAGAPWFDASGYASNALNINAVYEGRGSAGVTSSQYSSNVFGGAAGGSAPSSYGSGGGGDIFAPGSGGAGGGAGATLSFGVPRNAGVGGVRYGTNVLAPFSTGVGPGINGAAGSGFGNGGGGGGSSTAANAGNGGAGGTAAGGGGGGASTNGFTSGAGGAGGNGFCRVTTYS